MALTTEEVRKIASLARLRFTPEEEAAVAGQLGKIVDYIDQLQRFEAGAPPAAAIGAAVTEAAPAPRAPLPALASLPPPLASLPPLPPLPPLPAISRTAPEDDDLPRPCLPRESFLANAPAVLDGFLLVPEVRRPSMADTRQIPEARPGVGDDRSS